MDNFAIVILSCDAYSDAWDYFFTCFDKFWKPKNVKKYLVSNHKECKRRDIITICTGDEVPWSRKVRIALADIRENNLLVLLEDYFLCREVSKNEYESLVTCFTINNYDYLRLIPIPKENMKKPNGIYPLVEKSLYGINLQPAIWKKSFLLKILRDDDFSAWQLEALQKFGSNQRIKGNCSATNYPVYNYVGGIIQGQWYPPAIKCLKGLGIEMVLGNRSIMSNGDLRRIQLKAFMIEHLPASFIAKIKPLLKKLGFKFVTE
jgi:hypothetical protein